VSDFFVYVLTKKPRGTWYVGVTNDLVRRIYEHREGAVKLDLVQSSNPQWRDLWRDITR
jgi:predicted GIY-YIG superfamily endonuclease